VAADEDSRSPGSMTAVLTATGTTKEPEWNNKSTQVDTAAGRGLGNALQLDYLFYSGY
jgi:hypothetical protein